MVCLLSTLLNHRRSFWYPHVDNIDGFLNRASAVVAKVEHQLFSALAFQLDECLSDIAGTALGKTKEIDVAYIIAKHSIIWHF